MKWTYKTYLRIGVISFIILGIGHLFGEAQMSSDGSIEKHLDQYDFKLLGSTFSLYQFHLGYSVMMGLIIFIGLLLLTLKEIQKQTLLLLAIGSIIICGLIWYFFALPGQIFSTISAVFFSLAYWKFPKVE